MVLAWLFCGILNNRFLLIILGVRVVDDSNLPKVFYIQIGLCCKYIDELAFRVIERSYLSKTLLTRRISPR